MNLPDLDFFNDPPADPAPADPCGCVTITLTAIPCDAAAPPPSIRLRRLLTVALRTFGFRASWPAPAGHEKGAAAA